MRQRINELVFITAFKDELDDNLNNTKHKLLGDLLKGLRAEFSIVDGYYKGVKNKSYMVYINRYKDLTLDRLVTIGYDFGQDCILYRGGTKKAKLIGCDIENSWSEDLGFANIVPASELDLNSLPESYTYFPATDNYMLCRKIG